MKHYLTMILAGWSMAANAEHLSEPGNLSLHYDAPASDWQSECLPIGNGQMGAMLFGQVDQERIQFNEESLWIGNEDDTGAYQNFGEVMMMFESGDRLSPIRATMSRRARKASWRAPMANVRPSGAWNTVVASLSSGRWR
jgi:hypothetical protein